MRIKYPEFVKEIDQVYHIRNSFAHPKTMDDMGYLRGMSAPVFFIEDKNGNERTMTVETFKLQEQKILSLLAEVDKIRDELRSK